MLRWLWNLSPHWISALGGAEMMGGAVSNIWPSLWWLSAIAILLGATHLGIGLYRVLRERRQRTRRSNMDIAIASAVALLVFVAVLFGVRYINYLRNDIIWSETDRPLAHVASLPANAYLVEHFGLHGTSNRSEPIKVKTAYLRSLVGNGEKLPITLDSVPAGGAEIEPGVTFHAATMFPNEAPAGAGISGMTPEHFWQRFAQFEFVLETTERKYKFTYGEDTTRPFLDGIESMKRGAPKDRPTVIPKKANDADRR